MRKGVINNTDMVSSFNQIVKWVVAVFFAILPVFYFGKDIINAGNTPARILFLIFLVILLYLCGQKIVNTGRLRLPGKLTAPLVALLMVIFASAVFSPLKMQVLHTQIWSEEMLLSQWMAGIFMLFCLYQLLDTDELIYSAIFAVAIGGGVAAVIGLLDFFVFKSLGVMSAVRLTGTFFNPMFAGNYLLICIPFAIGAAMITKKSLYYIIVGLLALSVVFTNARAAWVALFIYAVYLVIYFAMKNRRWALTAITGLVVLAGLIFVIPQTRGRIIALTQGDNATRARIVYMRTAWNEFLARPIIGWGVDSAQQVSPQFRPLSDASESNNGGRRVMLDEDHSESLPHNIILLILAELGVIGLIAISWLKLSIIGVVRKNGGMQDVVIFTAVGALITWGIANLFSYDNAAITCLPWLAITMIALRNKNIYFEPISIKVSRILYVVALIIAILTMVSLGSYSKINRAVAMTDNIKNGTYDTARCYMVAAEALALLQSIPMPDNAVYIRIVDLTDLRYQFAPDDGSRETARVQLLSTISDGLGVYYRDWQLLRNGTILNFRFSTPARALEFIKAMKEYEPNSAQVYVFDAEAKMLMGDVPAAEKPVNEALRIAPNSPLPYVEAGKLYLRLFNGGDSRRQKLLKLSEDAFRRGADIDIVAFKVSSIVEFCTVLVINRKYDDVAKYGKYLRDNKRVFLALREEITRVLALTGDTSARDEIFRKLDE